MTNEKPGICARLWCSRIGRYVKSAPSADRHWHCRWRLGPQLRARVTRQNRSKLLRDLGYKRNRAATPLAPVKRARYGRSWPLVRYPYWLSDTQWATVKSGGGLFAMALPIIAPAATPVHQRLAASSAATSSAVRERFAALAKLSTCASLVALAIGAVRRAAFKNFCWLQPGCESLCV